MSNSNTTKSIIPTFVRYKDNTNENTTQNTLSQETLLNTAISKIKTGTPVILLIGNEAPNENGKLEWYNGHFVIAYDYNENAANAWDGIYVHPGWYNSNYPAYTYTHVKLSFLNRNVIESVIALDFSTILSHSCSNNYYRNAASYCVCTLGCHSEHVHNSLEGYTECNDEQHYSICRCGEMILEDHTLTGIVNNNWMCAYCPHCGYLKQLYEIGT